MCLCHIDGHVVDLVLFQHSQHFLLGILGGGETQHVNVVLEVVLELQDKKGLAVS